MNGKATRMGTATLSGRSEHAISTLQRKMHNASGAHHNGCDLIVILAAVIVENMKSHTYPYTFSTTDEVHLLWKMCTRSHVHMGQSSSDTQGRYKYPPRPSCLLPRSRTTNTRSSRAMKKRRVQPLKSACLRQPLTSTYTASSECSKSQMRNVFLVQLTQRMLLSWTLPSASMVLTSVMTSSSLQFTAFCR